MATTQRPGSRVDQIDGRDTSQIAPYVWAITRISLGLIFLWAFLDKAFGLGRATPAENAWIDGGSPTAGFLSNAPTGPFEDVYKDLAVATWADWLFMLGLLAIGVALILGVGMWLAAIAGALLLVLMWTAVLPPENHPFLDDHLIYAMVLIGLAAIHAGDVWGLGKQWASTSLVGKYPILR